MKSLAFLACYSLVFIAPSMAYSSHCYYRAKNKIIVKEKVVAVQVPVVVVPTYSATYIPPAPIVIQQGSAVVAQQQYAVAQQQQYAVQQSYAVAPQQQVYAARQTQAYTQQAECPPQQMRQELDIGSTLVRIDRRLAILEAKCEITANGNGNVFKQKTNNNHVNNKLPSAFQTKCVVCHNANVAHERAEGHALFNRGQLLKLSDSTLTKMGEKVNNHTMPPPDNNLNIQPLTDQELAEINAWLETQKDS